MAVEYGNSIAMNNLGYVYGQIKDYDNMFKYYHMAIEHGSIFAINNLITYYEGIADNINLKKYYLLKMTFNKDEPRNSPNSFSPSFGKDEVPIKVFSYAKEDYEWFIEIYPSHKEYIRKYPKELCDLIIHYLSTRTDISELLDIILEIDCSENLCLSFIKRILMEKIDLMDLHFNYSIEGKGFNDAKQDFFNLLSL
jgi:hypothetical protein